MLHDVIQIHFVQLLVLVQNECSVSYGKTVTKQILNDVTKSSIFRKQQH